MDFIKIHPIMTLLGGEGDGLSSTVKCIDEMCISLHGYLTEDDTLDLDEYYQAIHGTAA